MQQRNLGKEIWQLFCPLVLQFVVALAVETVIIGVLYIQYIPELSGSAVTQARLTEITMEITNVIYLYITEVSALAALATIPFLVIMIGSDQRKERKAGILPNKKAPWIKYVYVAVVGISFSLGLNNLLLLSNLAEYSEAYQETAKALYAPPFPVQILCVGIVIPIMEELIFRGLIYRRMRQNMSMIKAIIYSSIAFGLYHGNSVQFIYALFAGALLAFLYEKYGSVKASIFAHMLMNIVSSALTEAKVFTWIFSDMMRMAVITIGCAAIASSMFVLISKIEEKPERPGEEEKTGKEKVLQDCE